MKKLIIWLLSVALLASVALNVIVSKANLKYFEDSYKDLARQQVKYMEIHALLESSNIAEAKLIIENEIKWRSGVLAVCLMEKCSEGANEVLRSSKDLK